MPITLFGQNMFSMECDSNYLISHNNLIERRNEGFTLNPEFELRIWIEGGLPTIPPSPDDLINLIFNKGKWHLDHYRFHYRRGKKIVVERIEAKNVEYDSLYNYLVNNNLLTLPKQNTLINRAYEEHKGGMLSFGDGTEYKFEILTPKCCRTYSYMMPKSYWYSHQYKEYQNIVNILTRLFTLSGIYYRVY